jgi:hypothetical protein
MPSAYANQSAGELSSMCDGPQTMEALAVRRSRDVGGGKLHVTQERVREVLEGVWKSGPRGWKDKGRRQDKAIPEAWNWKLKGTRKQRRLRLVVGGMALGSVAWGRSFVWRRSGPLPLMPSNQVGPRAFAGVIVSILDELGSSLKAHTSFSACSDGLEAVFGRRQVLNIRLCHRINNSILPESLLGKRNEGISALSVRL